jgi:hypothetical protein
MIKENLKLTGNVKMVLTDKDGNIKSETSIPNLVVKVGRNFIASRMIAATADVMSHMAIGTGSTAAGAAQTVLVTEVARVALTASIVGADPDQNVVTYTATFNPGTPGSAAGVVEAGLFNASTDGTMLCRTTFPVVNKGTDDTLSITWTITINAA